MSSKIYNKLVRDRIPEIIHSSGKKAIVEKLDEKDYIRLLNSKLEEELQEYKESKAIEELADLIEVVYAILRQQEISHEEFELIRLKKLSEKGGFENGYY